MRIGFVPQLYTEYTCAVRLNSTAELGRVDECRAIASCGHPLQAMHVLDGQMQRHGPWSRLLPQNGVNCGHTDGWFAYRGGIVVHAPQESTCQMTNKPCGDIVAVFV